jgi:transcriptional regulator with XRE-family HTH domain
MTKGTFAESIGIDPSAYSRLIQGRELLKAEYAWRIAKRYDIPMDYLYDGNFRGMNPEIAEKIQKLALEAP